ncbi:membrane protein [hydrocarbon metagenome]|uniref:Membrane protein n=1 Tax=hydrocarbon metagenome TaxID=938273 RepID=A0A0W8EGL5_9ZZZZ
MYYAFQALMIGDTFRFMVVLIPSLALSLLPVVFEYVLKVTLPPGVKPLISLALLLHVAGGISRFYWKFAPFYDKVAHVCSALALFLLIITFFVVLDYLGKTVRWRTILISSLLITTVFMVSWEISEYLIDVMAKTSYNNGIGDSTGDLIANCIGILIGIFIVRYYRRIIPAGKNPGYLLTL